MHAELLGASALSVVDAIGRSVREAFYMFWATLWALVLGFGLAGAVQAFVSRESMQRSLGNHGPAATVRASLYGMASSSCSYAASAMARSLFARGADYLSAMVFMFASTNLVVELGLVLLVLIGWQFVAAELVGGVIMIVLLVLLGGLWFRGKVLAEARDHVEESRRNQGEHDGSGGQGEHDGSGGHGEHGGSGGHGEHGGSAENGNVHRGHGEAPDDGVRTRSGWRERIWTRAGWADAAGYTMSDLTMLRKEMAIGYVVAGFLATLIPTWLWTDVFVRGHGAWTTLENVAVGPLVALLSFVCSVGNVPLAAALWSGGISFGGVVAFVFADLISLPLVLVYRKQYGGRMATRMLFVFWLTMSCAGLVTEYVFRAGGWVPTRRVAHVIGSTLAWNATTALDIVAIVTFAVLYWLYKNRARFGAGVRYAKDPICGMQVEIVHAPASHRRGTETYYFCCERCRDRFLGAALGDAAHEHTTKDAPPVGA